MPIPNDVLDYLANEYLLARVKPNYPFIKWATIRATRMGWKI